MEDTESSATIPRRKAAQTASKVFSEQLDADSQTSGPEANHAGSATGDRRPRKKSRYPKGYKSRKAAAAKPAGSGSRSSPPHLAVDETAPPTDSTSNDKDTSTDANNNNSIGMDSLSDLTSVPSDEESSSSDIVVTVSTRKTVLPKPFPLSVFEDSTPIAEPSSSKISKTQKLKASGPKSTSGSGRPRGRPRTSFKPSDFDNYVWVLIALDTEDLYDKETAQGKGVWWPGKVQKPHTTNEHIEVKLFGKGIVYVPSFSTNIIPEKNQGVKLKFNKPSYVHPKNVPRKKKRKGEQDGMENVWQAALDAMKSDMDPSTVVVHTADIPDLAATDDEELPLYVKPNPSAPKPVSVPSTTSQSQAANANSGSRIRGKKRKRVNKDSDDSMSDESDSLLYRKQEGDGGEVDISLEIPGELVIGRSKNQLNVYWPAKIEAYVPPSKPGQAGKYHIIFLDGTREDIPRDWFYTMVEPGFALCKLGQFISKDPNQVVDNDEEEEDEEEDRPSPVPQDPPPIREEFLELPIAQQFVYTKGIMRAILNDSYVPSRHKHDNFVKGGKYRKHVTNAALLRGMMNAKDVERLHKIVLNWCLKNFPEDDDPPEPPAIEDAQKDRQNTAPVPVDAIPSVAAVDDTAKQDIVMEDPPIANDPPEHVDTDGLVLDAFTSPRLTDYVHPESAIRFTSPSPTDKLLSSPPPEMPPSSNPFSAYDYSSSQQSVLPTQNSETISSPPPSSFVPSVIADELHDEDAEGDLSDLTPVEEEDEEVTASLHTPQRLFVPFQSLGPLDQVEYCSNVLVPEAVRQILLWRSGERTQVGLLSPEREKALYDKGQMLLVERDWVFDVMRLREKQLQKHRTQSEKQARKRNGESLRPKRNVGMPKY